MAPNWPYWKQIWTNYLTSLYTVVCRNVVFKNYLSIHSKGCNMGTGSVLGNGILLVRNLGVLLKMGFEKDCALWTVFWGICKKKKKSSNIYHFCLYVFQKSTKNKCFHTAVPFCTTSCSGRNKRSLHHCIFWKSVSAVFSELMFSTNDSCCNIHTENMKWSNAFWEDLDISEACLLQICHTY